MSISENLQLIQQQLPASVTLVAVSKTKPVSAIEEAYQAGQRIFGENKVQEMCEKYEQLPKDIQWHLIGHLQSNKVKYMAPFVSLIHGVDSFKLLQEINSQAIKNNRIINCLLQIRIAQEETKFGLTFEDAQAVLNHPEFKNLQNICIKGVMGMATFTEDEAQIRDEFKMLKRIFDVFKEQFSFDNTDFQTISMGMSGDFQLAIEEGSTMVRVGSSIFGGR